MRSISGSGMSLREVRFPARGYHDAYGWGHFYVKIDGGRKDIETRRKKDWDDEIPRAAEVSQVAWQEPGSGLAVPVLRFRALQTQCFFFFDLPELSSGDGFVTGGGLNVNGSESVNGMLIR